jgi:salicylate hydroxylase
MDKMAVAICGGGVGGMAAAIALGSQGHEVTIFEQAPALAVSAPT